MNSPQPPIDNSNDSLFKSIKDQMNHANYLNGNGLKFRSFTQQEVDGMTELTYVGRIIYNTTINSPMVSYLDTGTNTAKWRAI